MKNNHVHHSCLDHDNDGSPEHVPAKRWKLVYWLVGIGSLIWLVLRSGTRPRRLAYPCQRAAATVSLGFLGYLAALLSSATLLRRLKAAFSPGKLMLFVVGLLLTVALQSSVTDPAAPILAASPDLPGWTSPTAISNVFAITDVPVPQYTLNGGTIPGGASADEALHDDGVDALVSLMETNGDYFYKTGAHPNGLFGSNDVVVIKINNQWGGRNGTNTDVVKGVIYRLVKHPGGFTGAVIIAENAQGAKANWYNESSNNSQFQDQSYQEVAQAFASQGYRVCVSDWNSFYSTFVGDYDAGNTSNGYVLDAADNKLSYPKFQVNCNGMNLQISMRKGLWNGSTFDNTRLKMINLPVLKRHGGAKATIAVKNYLGFISTAGARWADVPEIHCWLLGASAGNTCSQTSTNYGLIARQVARIRRANLDIVDAIWVNPCDNASWHGAARRQDVLLASRDPFAVDYYASDYVLGPLIQQYGSACGATDYVQSKASTHGGWFRNIQMRNVARLRAEGVTNTINMSDSMTPEQERAQFNAYVVGANEPVLPTLTLQVPNGGEIWKVGKQEDIRWSSTGAVGDVRLEYSTDGFAHTHTIITSTANDGVYKWTIPNDLSNNVRVRVVSASDATVNDTSDAPFTITARTFEDSFKRVSQVNLEGGEAITYTIVLYEGTSATFALTDTVPSPCTYVLGSASVRPSWKAPVQDSGGTRVRWSDVVTSTVPVTITFQVQVPVTTTTWAIINWAMVSRNSATPVTLSALSILNGFQTYLPIVLRSY